MKSTKSYGAGLGLLPGERITLAKSGRAVTPVETWLSASLCGHVSHGMLMSGTDVGVSKRVVRLWRWATNT